MSHGDHLTSNRGATRFLLLALGIPQALIGIWALLAPRSFYDDFPAGTDGWVNALGPYDEHLVRDVGSLFVALGVLLVFAAWSLRRGTVVAAAVAWLLFAVPHFVWHVFNLEPYPTADAVANTATLAWTVAGGVLVLVLALRRPAERPAPVATGSNGSRIEGVGDARAGLVARAAFRYSRRDLGAVPEPLRVFAHHPGILAGYAGLEYATEKADRLPPRLKVLAATKAAALAGCEFCMDIGSMISSRAGVTEAQLRALPEHSTSDEFTGDEKLVLDLAVGMSRTPVEVSDELFARLRERFDEAQLVELVNEIAVENYRARFDWAFGIGSQGFTEGAFCVRPERPPQAVGGGVPGA
ncbi:MAG TPA: carboxymuconolactone decarboxylase family protein [Thermoleophilaceae bacterium]|nr:carboxymuconolactone decarboxylase family protein [Thermoleophilaceae bacterium]